MEQTDDKLREYLKLVTAELQSTRKRLHEAESAEHEPMAVIGMSCRFPGGVNSPEDLWSVVEEGRDVVDTLPENRGWDLEGLYAPDPLEGGSSYVRAGGFLYDAGDFDAELFGISPREALAMDPQQRMLLESSWELFERAGFDPKSLSGRDVGVFVGGMPQHYAPRHDDPAAAELDGYLAVGNTTSVLSGRIAYTFGLQGPTFSVDTACSSSLTALHLSVQALRNGECSMAVAGGVTIMSTPDWIIGLSRQQGLSVDGRCKAFSAAADGFGIAEGVGLLLLEPLSEAMRNQHEVLAVVRGSAANQDGASNGLTAPNEQAQVDVINRALSDARVTASDVDVVEAHGTGTPLGDPIEAHALSEAYGRNRAADQPLFVGSLKSNIGHAQAAAGVGGVIKMVESLRHGLLPRTLHAESPSPHVDWQSSGLELLTDSRRLETGTDDLRRAGVSSFGISGTNVHVILEQAPSSASQHAGGDALPASDIVLKADTTPLLISASTPKALSAQSGRLARFLESEHAPELRDTASALVQTRASMSRRAVVLAVEPTATVASLRALESGEDAANIVTGCHDVDGRVAFVFPGQGGQWWRMGADLIESSPAFAARLAECEAALKLCTDIPAVEMLVRGAAEEAALANVEIVQCASWAVMVSLAEAWRSVGVEPAAVVGHSQGEIAAAVVCGALSLEDAARVVASRASMVAENLAGRGAMAAVPLSEDEVDRLIQPWRCEISLAAVNGPKSTVVSGEPAAVEQLLSKCSESEVDARRIAVDYASHSSQVEATREPLKRVLRDITPRSTQIPFYSTVTGSAFDGCGLDGDYWYRNLRQTVNFDKAVRTMLADGFGFFIESSAHPVLAMAMEQVFDATGVDAVALGTLRRDEGGASQLLTSVAEGHVRGLPGVDWATLCGPKSNARVDLPTYAFHRARYWLEPTARVNDVAPAQPSSDGIETKFEALGEHFGSLSSKEQEAELVNLVRATAAQVLRYEAVEDIPSDRVFRDMGFDSLAAVKFRNRLKSVTGLPIPTTVVYAHPTPSALARHLLRELKDPGDRAKRRILDELDRLDNNLAQLSSDDPDKQQIGKRLEALLRKWNGHNVSIDSGHITDSTLDSVSDEEMFALIDKEFGA